MNASARFGLFLTLISSSAFATTTYTPNQGAVIEKCEYGEGEAQVTVAIHKEFKKGKAYTADVTHGTSFKRVGIELEMIPGLTNETERGYAGLNPKRDRTILNMNYGKNMSGSMNFNDAGVKFETPELKCVEIR